MDKALADVLKTTIYHIIFFSGGVRANVDVISRLTAKFVKG
jgi:hypothetical protein